MPDVNDTNQGREVNFTIRMAAINAVGPGYDLNNKLKSDYDGYIGIQPY